ncbi:hypothetical protein BABINDRAFT_161543 [Babjeviella inositovora NRRL Y-12698]|uniref:Importin N-terminal domain-containing protein n=1 Tax=Babjeviella inositovora NRRL Y-12698 TaxID=984486 RepID=A0A1E3QQA5_9ASCO|nr:uncharacterized protein BABINDRAFT_161543 [Babjeviella inositovora NRRL Y-12698]ODQ79865.1 hypothetical protein BABINDRAFT_161543 [Babjeviella inositovora NRRL Y-12698]
MSWNPDPQALEQLKRILGATLSVDAATREEATAALDQAKQEADVDMYLLYILALDSQGDSSIRASAGTVYKNKITSSYGRATLEHVKEYVKTQVLNGLLDGDRRVRNITGNVITSLFFSLGMEQWAQVLTQLMDLAAGASGVAEATQEGAIGALAKICEDSAQKLNKPLNGERPLDYLMPKFMELTNSTRAPVRARAIHCINQFIELRTQSFLVHLDAFLARLFALATDPFAELRRNICTAFTLILETRADKLVPHLDGIINYCLHSVNDENKEVSLEACDFLLNLSTSEMPEEMVVSKLPLILPVLLDKMVYSADELIDLAAIDAADDAAVADRDQDIRPQNVKTREHTVAKANGEDEDEDEDDTDSTEWTLRKCAAATLDVLSSLYCAQVLDCTLPLLKDRIVSDQWPVCEAAILAFGAIAEGGAHDQLPELVPFLVERMTAPQPRVRQIACWTLSRYALWVCLEASVGGQCANYFIPTLEAIVSCALDQKKIVQQAACSSLACFIEACELELLRPLMEPLLVHFSKCFEVYQRKNMIILYDSVQTFVEKVGSLLTEKNYADMLLPNLIAKWQRLDDEDEELWPLLECMSSVAASLGEVFAPYALPVCARAVAILANCISLEEQNRVNPLVPTLSKDFMVTSIDLIDGLVQGLGTHCVELFQQAASEAKLMELLLHCFEDEENDVRQSAFALLGDLAIACHAEMVAPCLQPVIVAIGEEITSRTMGTSAVCNNATWALGEIALQASPEAIAPYIDNLCGCLISLLSSAFDIEETVLENAAITLGRMGIHSPGALAPDISAFFLLWGQYMDGLIENDEKDSAFQGMCQVLAVNPNFITTPEDRRALGVFVAAIAFYEQPSAKLREMFASVLGGYRAMFASDWEVFVGESMDVELRGALQSKYNV